MSPGRSMPLTGEPLRFLLYSHDGVGIGHTRRNLAIAAALRRLDPQVSVLLATGTDDAHRLGLPTGVEIVKLPALRKVANDQYHARRLQVGADGIRRLRASLLEATVQSFGPHVVLVDKHPFGARGEFRAGLDLARRQGARLVLGLRDILDDPATVRSEWAEYHLQQAVAAFHDRVLIYGDRAVFDPIEPYGFPDCVAERTRFCGYIVHEGTDEDPAGAGEGPFLPHSPDKPVVIACAGGGEDGAVLFENFLKSCLGAPWQGVVVAGPMTPSDERRRLRVLAEETGVPFHTFVPRLSDLFDHADALVCMGGYNTLAEALAVGLPTVCVPRIVPRTEQLLRARAFARLGLLEAVEPAHLSPTTLRAAMSRALGQKRSELRVRAGQVLNLDGAATAARELFAVGQGNSVSAYPWVLAGDS